MFSGRRAKAAGDFHATHGDSSIGCLADQACPLSVPGAARWRSRRARGTKGTLPTHFAVLWSRAPSRAQRSGARRARTGGSCEVANGAGGPVSGASDEEAPGRRSGRGLTSHGTGEGGVSPGERPERDTRGMPCARPSASGAAASEAQANRGLPAAAPGPRFATPSRNEAVCPCHAVGKAPACSPRAVVPSTDIGSTAQRNACCAPPGYRIDYLAGAAWGIGRRRRPVAGIGARGLGTSAARRVRRSAG